VRISLLSRAFRALRNGRVGDAAAYKAAALTGPAYPEAYAAVSALRAPIPDMARLASVSYRDGTFGKAYDDFVRSHGITPLQVSDAVRDELQPIHPVAVRYLALHDLFLARNSTSLPRALGQHHNGQSVDSGPHSMSLPTPTLQTARLLMRPFAESDADAIYALQSNARVLRYWDSPPWTDRGRADAFIAACREMEKDGSGARFAIERRRDNTFVGWCSMFRWNPVYRSLGIGYCFQEAAWGHGYATEAVRAMLQWAYGALDLNRVEAELDTRNAASARVLEKLGFMREGLRREDCIVCGEVSDSWIYGLLRRDWKSDPGVVLVIRGA
jgi:[ribosomal protein S5]-alanine N-acetyltransferase